MNESFIDKRDEFVDFPLERLHLWEYMEKQKGQKDEYELYGIVNHHSYSKHGGHYTVFIKVENYTWVKCNDSVLTCSIAKDVVTKDAYLLFYKRSEFDSSNIINLTY